MGRSCPFAIARESTGRTESTCNSLGKCRLDAARQRGRVTNVLLETASYGRAGLLTKYLQTPHSIQRSRWTIEETRYTMRTWPAHCSYLPLPRGKGID